jgi:hypothetical protein
MDFKWIVKSSGVLNVETTNEGIGELGGECSCGYDGTFWSGAINNDCSKISCKNGTPKGCKLKEKSGDLWVGNMLSRALPAGPEITPKEAALTVEIIFSNDSIIDLSYCEINTANACIAILGTSPDASKLNFNLRPGEKKVVQVNLGRTWKITDHLRTLAIYRLLRKQTPDISQIRIVN